MGEDTRAAARRHMKWPRAIFVFTVVVVVAFAVEAIARTGWFLIVPPFTSDRAVLIRVCAADSIAKARAELSGLPDAEQDRILEKAVKILAIQPNVARVEALVEATQDTSAPLSKWRQLKAFDSAASCEDTRLSLLQRFQADARRIRSSPLDEKDATEAAKVLTWLSDLGKSRCIPESALFTR
jgi:hypothetical protein